MSKVCKTCRVEKDLNEYYVHPKMADGHLNICKDCTKKRVAVHREQNIEKIREYDRNRPNKKQRVEDCKKRERLLYESNKEKYLFIKNQREKRHRLLHKEKYFARNAVNNAVRDKKLMPLPCERCGSIYRIEAHHPDYSKPLDVIWLCDPCHKEEHKRLRKIQRELQAAN